MTLTIQNMSGIGYSSELVSIPLHIQQEIHVSLDSAFKRHNRPWEWRPGGGKRGWGFPFPRRSVILFCIYCSFFNGKMRRYLALALTAVLLSSIALTGKCQDDEIEDIDIVEEEKAFLLIRKNVVDKEKVVVGKSVTVEIEVHNAGTR